MTVFGLFDPQKKFEKHAKRVANRRAYGPDRWESISFLKKQGTQDAYRALVRRFEFTSDPTIQDQDEKEAVLDALREGGEPALAAIKDALLTTSSPSWVLKALTTLASPDEVTQVLVDVLSTLDTGYERDPQRKLQILGFVEAPVAPALQPPLTRFCEDASEAVRFLAVTLLTEAAPEPTTRQKVLAHLDREESRRICLRVKEQAERQNWELNAEQKQQLKR